jgi:replicative DNA helicase
MEQEAYRHVPYDIEIEQAVLGSLLVDNSIIDVIATDLEHFHFYDPLHARIYDMMLVLILEGNVTPLVLHAVMKADPGLQEVGGYTYLADLAQSAPAMPNILDYARILVELATRRGLIRIGEDLVNAAYEQPHEMPAKRISEQTTEALLNLGRATAKPIMSAYDIAMESLKEVEAVAIGKPVPMVKTGLRKLDEEIGGLRGGDMIVIAGKSGMGKTALLGSVCLNTARAEIPTIVFSLEMMRRQWVERMVCDLDFDTATKPLWYSRVRNARINNEEIFRFGNAMQALHGLPFEIHDEDDLTIQQITARARAFASKHRGQLGIVAIDYLQIVSATDPRGQNREQVVASIARGVKSLAKRLGWPVMVGSQMNENDMARGKEEKRPQLADLRESKAIGNEADLVLSPSRPAYFVENRKPTDALPGDPAWLAWKGELAACANRMELLALKNRHGRRFDLELYCDMGASAIRDEAPYRPTLAQAQSDQHAADLLEYGAGR